MLSWRLNKKNHGKLMTNNKEADSQMQRTVCRDVCREHMYVENVCMYVENRCREPVRKWEKGRGHIQVGI